MPPWKTIDLQIAPYIEELEIVAQRGHKDPSTENLLLALMELYHEYPTLIEEFIALVLLRAMQQQLEITPRAFRLSLLTAVKLDLRTREIRDYEFFSVDMWKQVVLECLSRADEEFANDCLRDVSTVKIYRYVALQILGGFLNHARPTFPKGLRILDGGCSINIGLKCLNDLAIFQDIEYSPEILQVLGGKLPTFLLQYAYGIDKYSPNLERTLASLFPSEVKFWEALYTKLYYLNKKKIEYHQQDILYLTQHQEYAEAFDIVFLSSLLRRFPPHQVAEVLVQIAYMTDTHSFLVINEQMSKETIEGGGTYATFIVPKEDLKRIIQQFRGRIDLYQLLNMALQLFVYPDENCQKVFAGKHLKTFLQHYTTLSGLMV
ncbi:hypothetical protein U27_02266 [Candidatus Vecturithrix granuli]|uniref:Uncharacterized protein n=1 Tax=Vecturithrix granuli TaxID=1499967 RepID=A0A0S6W710_VECG1|nr:hypothetical protein U27_02266 [Candidatus Vecturithrix granuli]